MEIFNVLYKMKEKKIIIINAFFQLSYLYKKLGRKSSIFI